MQAGFVLLSSEVSEMKVVFHFRASDDIKRFNLSRLAAIARWAQGLPWGINTFYNNCMSSKKTKAEKREKKKKLKMLVSGKSVFRIQSIIGSKSRKHKA